MGPKVTSQDPMTPPRRPTRRTAAGTIGASVSARATASGTSPAPVRSQVGASGTPTRWPGLQRGRDVGTAARDRAEAAHRGADERHVGSADDAQPAPARPLDRDAERGRLGDAEAAVRHDDRGTGREERARRPTTCTRTAAANSGRHEIGDLRIEPERVDRDSGPTSGGAARSSGASRATDPVGVEEPGSCGLLAGSRDRDDVGPVEQLAQDVLGRDEVA